MSTYTPGPWRLHSHRHPISNTWTHSIVTDEEYGDVLGSTNTAPMDPNAEGNARMMAAAPSLFAAQEPDRSGPDFLDWVADRLVHVYGDPEGSDFVICLRRRAALAREAIARATQETDQ